MIKLAHCALAFAFLTSVAFAQKQMLRTFQRVTAPIKSAGVYHVATGTWTRASPSATTTSSLVGGTMDTIYSSTGRSSYFATLSAGHVVTASGRIPSTTSPRILWNPAASPDGSVPGSSIGCADQYQIDGFQIGYCTNQPAPTVAMTVAFFETWNPVCTSSLSAATPRGGPFALTGLPGAGTAAQACWTLTIDLSASTASFVMQADGNGAFGFGSNDAFGWTFTFPSITSTQTTGPLLAGCPSDATGPGTACQPAHPGVGWLQFPPARTDEAAGYDSRRFDDVPGACAPTFPANGSSFTWPGTTTTVEVGGDGLGNDGFRLEGGIAPPPGCFFFGGPASSPPPNGPYSGMWLELYAKVSCATVPPGFAFCAGDGLASPPTTACPCNNFGGPGNGCSSSFNGAGAHLAMSGSVASDSVVLHASGMQASGVCIFLKGDAVDPNGFTFGDGISCTGGTLIRLRAVALSAGAAAFPVPPETITLSARGGNSVGSGQLASYVAFYRNAAAAFCPPATFNSTNGQLLTW